MRLTPLLFGPLSRQLFGLYHATETRRSTEIAVLICPPFGQEAIRSHRLFRVLAEQLARSGVPVLRFDYFGTGNSPGEDADGEFDGWRLDVCAAHEELRRRSDARRIVWLGARLGATLAVLAARGGSYDPVRLLLWDPIVSGPAYLKHMRERHIDALERSYRTPDPTWRRQLARNPDAFTEETLGFAIAPALLRQLRGLGIESLHLSSSYETVVLAPHEDAIVQRWCQAEAARRTPVRLSSLKHPLTWTTDAHPHNAMVPAVALQHLLAAIR